MPNYDPKIQCRLEGQSELIFEIKSMGVFLREGDLFSYATSSGTPVNYKVESAVLDIRQGSGGSSEGDFWTTPVLRIGVSVVP